MKIFRNSHLRFSHISTYAWQQKVESFIETTQQLRKLMKAGINILHKKYSCVSFLISSYHMWHRRWWSEMRRKNWKNLKKRKVHISMDFAYIVDEKWFEYFMKSTYFSFSLWQHQSQTHDKTRKNSGCSVRAECYKKR